MNILFAMHGEAGHHLGTFRLARDLAARGHRISYLGHPQVQALVEAQGFAFLPFAGHASEGMAQVHGSTVATPPRGRWARRLAAERLFRRYTAALVDGTLDACLTSADADVLLCDSFLWSIAMRARCLGLPTIQVSTSLFLYDNLHIPPAVAGITPRPGPLSALRVILAWKLMHLRHGFTKRWASRLFGSYRAPLRMHHLSDAFFWVARRSGFRCRHGRTYVMDEIGPHLVLPELVLCSASFQFPGLLPRERYYCGDFIDLERKEQSLSFDPAGRPIIFCSLGTSAAAYAEARRFFDAVSAASRMAPEWFFVLHISDPALLGAFSSTDNLLVVSWIPQLALLRRAAVMVSHGGLNTIMECVQCQVPMVILPCARDQPGNAARAAFHHLALTAPIRSVTPERLMASVATAMKDPVLRAGLRRMRERISAEAGLSKAVNLIEAIASAHQKEFCESQRHPPFKAGVGRK